MMSESSKKTIETNMETDNAKKLIFEFHSLMDQFINRGSQFGTVQAIFISASFLGYAFLANIIKSDIKSSDFTSLLFGYITVIFGLIMVRLAKELHDSTVKLDHVYWERINEIEEQLGIEKGHKWIIKQIENEGWYKKRVKVWPRLYNLIMVLDIIIIIVLTLLLGISICNLFIR